MCLYTAPLFFLLTLTGSLRSLIIRDEVHGNNSTFLISLDWIANLIYNLIFVNSFVALFISSPAFFGFF